MNGNVSYCAYGSVDVQSLTLSLKGMLQLDAPFHLGYLYGW